MPLAFNLSDDPSCIGHHFIVGLSGPALNDADRKVLKKLRPMGVLLRAPNFRQGVEYSSWLNTLKKLFAEVQDLIGREKFIATIDHEGGRVHRTPAPLTHFPFAENQAKKSAQVAKAMALATCADFFAWFSANGKWVSGAGVRCTRPPS